MPSLDRPARSVQHAVAILRALADEPRGRRVGEIAQLVHLDKSSVSRILRTLEADKLTTRDQNGGYRLGLGIVEMAAAALEALDLRDVARSHLMDLARATGDTVNLAVWDGEAAVIVDNAPGPAPVLALGHVGQRFPAHCTALGKVLLSYQPKAVFEQLLSKRLTSFTEQTVTSKGALEAELVEIRRRGYDMNLGEYQRDVRGIAAPVRDHTGSVVAAVGLAGPAYRLDSATLNALTIDLLRTTAQISQQLGFAPSAGQVAPNRTPERGIEHESRV